ncbi:hypothetical protein [Sphaerotilus montanus]
MSTSGIKSSTFFPEDAVDGLFVVPQCRTKREGYGERVWRTRPG